MHLYVKCINLYVKWINLVGGTKSLVGTKLLWHWHLGCGAYSKSWPYSWVTVNIATKELVPNLLSTPVWGPCWQNWSVLFLSDNQDFITFLTRGQHEIYSWPSCWGTLILEANFGFEHQSEHLAGQMNAAADTLSWGWLSELYSLLPQAPCTSSWVPLSSWNWLQKELWCGYLHTGICCLVMLCKRCHPEHNVGINVCSDTLSGFLFTLTHSTPSPL